MMVAFSYLMPLSGGLLIGAAAALYLLMNGRVAGISGLVASTLGLAGPGAWNLGVSFLGGLLGGSALAATLIRPIDLQVSQSPILLITAGLLVGFGSRMGSGCTSGHGVCGIARLSRRSIISTVIFMSIAVLTVFVTHHIWKGPVS